MAQLLIFTFVLLLSLQPKMASATQQILQGTLHHSSQVRFEVIDGFAFQNYIKVYLDQKHLGNFMGSNGLGVNRFKLKVSELEAAVFEHGGHFYLPLTGRLQNGEPEIQQIIHFPDTRAQASTPLLGQEKCQRLQSEIEKVIREGQSFTHSIEALADKLEDRRPAGQLLDELISMPKLQD